ncbi:MAG: YceI family protein [Chitinophagaceae bacterium]|nr:YceI family protein [Chitinophagaceae bacterium]
MKKTLYFLSMIAFLASCQSAPSGENAQTAEQQEAAKAKGAAYTVDNAQSTLTFVGSKPVGTHTGTFKLTEGNLTVEDGNISSGKFTFDINSLNITDEDTSYKAKLTGHLLSPDFFDAAKYKTATFEITSCQALTNDTNGTHRISGNLTMKDSTKNVTFTSKVTLSDTQLKATADFNIDRTQWGLFYGNDKSLGDKFIYPEVKIKFDITANK